MLKATNAVGYLSAPISSGKSLCLRFLTRASDQLYYYLFSPGKIAHISWTTGA